MTSSRGTLVNSDPSELSTDHPIVKRENSTRYYINRYLKPYVDEQTLSYLLLTGTYPGKLYGSAKIHKKDCPTRPIVSFCSCPEYNLAKYLNNYITPCIDTEFSVGLNRNVIFQF